MKKLSGSKNIDERLVDPDDFQIGHITVFNDKTFPIYFNRSKFYIKIGKHGLNITKLISSLSDRRALWRSVLKTKK